MEWILFYLAAAAALVIVHTATDLKVPTIVSMSIRSDIKYRFATTQVTSRVKNADETSREAKFDVILPNEAFITKFTLDIDGEIIVGEIKEKEKAKKQYAAAQQRGESAGYIGTKHRETNKFNLAITVAPQSKVSFNLTYQELLKRKHGHYEQVIYIDPGQIIPDMDVSVSILESREITKLNVPPVSNDVDADLTDSIVSIYQNETSPKEAQIKYIPSEDHQREQSANGIAGKFVVQYDVERDSGAGDVLVVNGYFVHFFAPENKDLVPIPNDLLFILDVSGSMSGTKITQLKEAMLAILNQLNKGDRINIMTFSGGISFWKPEMMDIANEDTMEEAKTFITSIRANGWTNIELALREGIQFMSNRSGLEAGIRSPVLVFLTDGEATNGVTDEHLILRNVQVANEGNIPIFSLAFGNNADYELVKKVAIQNDGLGRKIYEASDADMQIAGFYSEIAVTLMSNLTFKYLDTPVKEVTKHTFTNYFEGSEIVVSGILSNYFNVTDDDWVICDLTPTMRFNGASGRSKLTLVLDEKIDETGFGTNTNLTNPGDFEMITEKVWAYLTIKQLLDKELASSDQEEKTSLKERIIKMSLKYDFVTPLTSMVVTKPHPDDGEDDDNINIVGEDDSFSSAYRDDEEDDDNINMAGEDDLFTHAYKAKSSGHRQQSVPMRASGRSSYLSMPDPQANYGPSGAIRLHSLSMPDLDPPADPMPMLDPIQAQFHPTQSSAKIPTRPTPPNTKKISYPLMVQFNQTMFGGRLCFNLLDDSLDTDPGTYLFYGYTGVSITITVETIVAGRWKRYGGIKSVKVVNNNTTLIIEGTSGKSKPEVITLDDITVTVKTVDAGYLHIFVQPNGGRALSSGITGIIGDILHKEIKKWRTPKKHRGTAYLRLKKKGPRGVLKKKILSQRNSVKNNCWAFKKTDDMFYSMASNTV